MDSRARGLFMQAKLWRARLHANMGTLRSVHLRMGAVRLFSAQAAC